jgi:shikimate kinase
MKHANLVLVGFMGTGKTVTGRRVAARLGREFVDMDAVIAARSGRSIPQIFAREGEAYFRKLERALVQELAARQDR